MGVCCHDRSRTPRLPAVVFPQNILPICHLAHGTMPPITLSQWIKRTFCIGPAIAFELKRSFMQCRKRYYLNSQIEPNNDPWGGRRTRSIKCKHFLNLSPICHFRRETMLTIKKRKTRLSYLSGVIKKWKMLHFTNCKPEREFDFRDAY
jgi:hypothetical protein